MGVLVTLYTRADCHLCDEAKAVLDRVAADQPFTLEIVDVDTDEGLVSQYGLEVPVVLIAGRKRFKYRVDEERLRKLLTLGNDGKL